MIRAMNYVINEGWCLYWGTAKWSHVEVFVELVVLISVNS